MSTDTWKSDSQIDATEGSMYSVDACLSLETAGSCVTGISFPEEQSLRARKVVTRSRARSTGKFPSLKNGRMMQYESPHELNAFRILECDSAVTSYAEQPCKVLYKDSEASRTHYPDILVKFIDRKELWEVKPRREAEKADVVRRTAILQGLEHWGYGYRLVHGEDLAAQPRLKNALCLLHFGSVRKVGILEREAIRLALNSQRRLLWGDVSHGMYGTVGTAAVCRLVLEGLLHVDICSVWSENTEFILREGGL